MSVEISVFDQWIRNRFVEINTLLEEYYYQQIKGETIDFSQVEKLKQCLLDEGREKIHVILEENNLPAEFAESFDLLGNVGLYMAACRRHGLGGAGEEKVSPLVEASKLSIRLGVSMGVAPRFVATHLSTANRSVAGRYRSFSSLEDEFIFLDYNTLGVIAYKKAADALLRILPMGITNPLSRMLLNDAKTALDDVLTYNKALNEKLDVDRFFYNIRPYYKTYRVGKIDYRGANAGDFSGINEVDMLLGLANAEDPFYLDVLIDKLPYVIPEDQQRLRQCMQMPNLLDNLLIEITEASEESLALFQENISLFLSVCESHAAAATYHHNILIDRYIDKPATNLPKSTFEDLTASGPPLDVLLAMLEKIRDLRAAADREDIRTRHADIETLKKLVQT